MAHSLLRKSFAKKCALVASFNVEIDFKTSKILVKKLGGPAQADTARSPHSGTSTNFSTDDLMPKGNLKFKERDVRRAIRAIAKEGIAVGRVAIDRDGNIVVAVRSGSDDNEKKNDFDGD
jgi:hypothetical protein